jgi:hypothetical protein
VVKKQGILTFVYIFPKNSPKNNTPFAPRLHNLVTLALSDMGCSAFYQTIPQLRLFSSSFWGATRAWPRFFFYQQKTHVPTYVTFKRGHVINSISLNSDLNLVLKVRRGFEHTVECSLGRRDDHYDMTHLGRGLC